MSGVFRTIDPPPPLHPERVSSPRTKGGGVHTRRAVRWVGGQYFGRRQTIGLASYSIIPIRAGSSMVMKFFDRSNDLFFMATIYKVWYFIFVVRWWGLRGTPNPRHRTVSDDRTFDPRDPFSTPSTQTQGTNNYFWISFFKIIKFSFWSVWTHNPAQIPEAKLLVHDWGIYVFDYVPQSENKNFATEHKRRDRERSYETG